MRQRLHVRKICTHPRAQQSKCACAYYVFYGRDHRFSVDVQLGTHVATYSEAMKLAEGWRRQIDDGVFVRRERGGPIPSGPRGQQSRDVFTLADFAAVYLRDCSMLKLAGKDLKDRQHPDYYVFQPLLAFALPDGRVLGQLPFAAVDEQMYELYIAARREQDYAASTVNKDVQLVTAMCRWAARRKYFGPYGVDPISGESRIIVRKPNAQRHRRVTDQELLALRPHTDPILWAFIELAMITCLRLTELYRLRWSDHRGFDLRVRPDATKVESAARDVPIDDRALAVLGYLRVDPAGRLYPDDAFIFGQCGEPPTNINDRFNTALLKAFPVRNDAGEAVAIDWVKGVHGPAASTRLAEIDLLFGDLRHEGALRKYHDGWALNEIQVLLGHTNLVQTSTYLGVGSEEIRRAMARHGSGAKAIGETQTTNPNYQELPIRALKRGPRAGGKHQVTH